MKIEVAGQQWDFVRFESHTRDDNAMGRCDTKLGKIYIAEEIEGDLYHATVIHEWLHGVLDVYGIEHDERVVNVLAAELFRKGFKVVHWNNTIKNKE